MQNEYVVIKEQRQLAPGIFRMALQADEIAAKAVPGQFVNLYCNDKSRLLPRPISICDVNPATGELVVVYAVVGDGTREFSQMEAGEKLRVIGPLGNGYRWDPADDREIFIVGGGLGIPPMLNLAKNIHKPEQVKIFLGFRSTPYMGQEFEGLGEVHYTSDDGSVGFHGNTVQGIQEYLKDQPARKRVLYTCGPLPMMKAMQRVWGQDDDMELWFSLEERMGCGFGACAGCPVKLRLPDGTIQREGVCKKGPVFPGKDVVFDE